MFKVIVKQPDLKQMLSFLPFKRNLNLLSRVTKVVVYIDTLMVNYFKIYVLLKFYVFLVFLAQSSYVHTQKIYDEKL